MSSIRPAAEKPYAAGRKYVLIAAKKGGNMQSPVAL